MTHIDQHTQALETPPGGRPRVRPASRRAALGSAVAVATVAGATVLGVATLASDDQNQVTGGPPSADQADNHTTQGSSPGGQPAASAAVSGWPAEDERFATCVEAETRSRAMLSSSDDGLPNPWETGNVAAKCYLSTDTSGAPSTTASGRVTEAP
jgi:hypothetical protein